MNEWTINIGRQVILCEKNRPHSTTKCPAKDISIYMRTKYVIKKALQINVDIVLKLAHSMNQNIGVFIPYTNLSSRWIKEVSGKDKFKME